MHEDGRAISYGLEENKGVRSSFLTGLVGIAEKAKRAVQEKIKKRTALDERDTGRINVASLSMAFEASLNAVVFTGAAILD
jgi:hypothetical protein